MTGLSPNEVLATCETCARKLYAGDMAFEYDDGPAFCWLHSPTWSDLKSHHEETDEMGEPVDPASRRRVLDRIANGEGHMRVASPL